MKNGKILTFNISVDDSATDDFDDIIVDVEYTGSVNRGLVLRHIAEEVESIFKKYLKNGKIKDITLAR